MKTVELTNGYTALVDDGDYELVSRYSWNGRKDTTGSVYAQTTIVNPTGVPFRQKTLSMHRLIMGVSGKTEVDHKDGITLDNRRENLRESDHRSNMRAFQRKRPGCTSRFRGVYWAKQISAWIADVQIRIGGKMKHHYAGSHPSEELAALAFNQRAAELGFLPEALNKVA